MKLRTIFGAVTLASLLASSFTVLVGCASTPPTGSVDTASRSDADLRRLAPLVSRLPFDTLMALDNATRARYEAALQLLIDDCMKTAGFKPVPAPPPIPRTFMERPEGDRTTLTNMYDPKDGYGAIHDAATERQLEAQSAYDREIDSQSAAYRQMLNGTDKPGQGANVGCVGNATAAISGQSLSADERYTVFIKPILNRAWDVGLTESGFLRAQHMWSLCLRDRGFNFDTADELSSDPRIGAESQRAWSLRLAQADVDCQWRSDLATRFHDGMAQAQQGAIEAHAETIHALQNAQKQELRRVDAVLRDHGQS